MTTDQPLVQNWLRICHPKGLESKLKKRVVIQMPKLSQSEMWSFIMSWKMFLNCACNQVFRKSRDLKCTMPLWDGVPIRDSRSLELSVFLFGRGIFDLFQRGFVKLVERERQRVSRPVPSRLEGCWFKQPHPHTHIVWACFGCRIVKTFCFSSEKWLWDIIFALDVAIDKSYNTVQVVLWID